MKKLSSLLIVLSISLLLSSIYIFFPQLPNSFDNRIKDLMFELRGEIKPQTNSVVIIDIDEKSLKELGQWPWSRNKLAQILTNLKNSNVAIIGLDILFAEEDRTSPHKFFNEFNIKKDDIPNYDLDFAQTVAMTPTILGYQFELSNKKFINKEAPSIQTIFIEKNKKLGSNYLIEAQGSILNLPLIQDNSYSSGFFNNIPDQSGIIRSVPLIISYDDSIYPSLALETLRIAMGVKKIIINYDENGVENLQLNDLTVPTDRHGRVLINFRGKEKTFKYISALDIYNNNFNEEDIEDKIALVGTSAAALMDLRATPFESIFPGVEVHANAIDNILNQDFLTKPSWVDGLNIFIIFALAFFSYYTIKKIPIIFTPIYIFIICSILFYIDYYLLFKKYLVVDMIFPVLTIILSSAISLVIEYFYEIKKREEIKNKFASKVSKDVMEQLINNQNENQLQSQDKNITVFFSDIRRFTTISEEINNPKILVEYLNRYMTPMSDIIIKNKGTIDKYIGDAIMAYWNAPFHVQDHEDKAVHSAIEQIRVLEDLNKEIQKDNLPKIEIGIGITTGIATIGEIGSIGRSDYTVIGDTINLGSRIESLCKFYGAKIIISEDTKVKLKDKYFIRYLDFIQVKGKNEPIKIYEIIDFKYKNETLENELELYKKALKSYHENDFLESLKLFDELLSKNEHLTYKIYKDRISGYLNNNIEFNEIFKHNEK